MRSCSHHLLLQLKNNYNTKDFAPFFANNYQWATLLVCDKTKPKAQMKMFKKKVLIACKSFVLCLHTTPNSATDNGVESIQN